MVIRVNPCSFLPCQPPSACPGDGDAFWEEYTDALLPAPEALCLPSCWEPHRLEQLQHPAIAEAARAQQVGPGRVLRPTARAFAGAWHAEHGLWWAGPRRREVPGVP